MEIPTPTIGLHNYSKYIPFLIWVNSLSSDAPIWQYLYNCNIVLTKQVIAFAILCAFSYANLELYIPKASIKVPQYTNMQ